MADKTPEMPVISNQGYYWPGKDYANSYIEDVKNPEDFGAGTLSRFTFFKHIYYPAMDPGAFLTFLG
jgi:hypothetical protein